MGIEVAKIKISNNSNISSETHSNDDIYKFITNHEVEEMIINRIEKKAKIFLKNFNIDNLFVLKIVEIFKEIIEITKYIQVQYINIITIP